MSQFHLTIITVGIPTFHYETNKNKKAKLYYDIDIYYGFFQVRTCHNK